MVSAKDRSGRVQNKNNADIALEMMVLLCFYTLTKLALQVLSFIFV